MAATVNQVSSYVYYIGSYGPKRALIIGTITAIDDDQEDKYQLEGEPSEKYFLESEIFQTKEDCTDYFDSLIQELD